MPNRGILAVVAIGCGLATVLWVRTAVYGRRLVRRLEQAGTEPEARMLTSGVLARDVHLVVLYLVVGLTAALAALTDDAAAFALLLLLLAPAVTTAWLSRYARRDARLSYQRLELEQRAREVLTQEETAPHRWAERLAPTTIGELDDYAVGTAHQAGSGVLSGDFVDVFHLPSGRLVCVVGDVTGHGVEASITALQVKYVLRSYLRRFRDPGQALEELNAQLKDLERPEEFVSLFVAVFDRPASTVRYASAGHPPGWHCSERVPHGLRSTGPLLMMDPTADYRSVERPFLPGDVLLVATDGLLEARTGDQFFGEERVASLLRREADTAPEVLCKSLIDAAVEFVQGPLADDVSVLAVTAR